jgi:hypothetical protein
MSLNQLINPVKPLNIVCDRIEAKGTDPMNNQSSFDGVLNVNNLNNSSYGYSDASSRFTINPSDTSTTGFTESRLLVERKYMAHRNSPEQFDPVNYTHYKGTIGFSTNLTPSQSVVFNLKVSDDGVNDRNDPTGNTAISYSGIGQQIISGTTKLQLATTTAIEVSGTFLKLTFFNPELVNLPASSVFEVNFDICIENL